MKNIFSDFLSRDVGESRFKIGWYTASSLSGFVAGVIAASIVWFAAIWTMKLFHLL